MIQPSWREIADRAVVLLIDCNVPAEEVMRCVGVSELGIRMAIERVKSGRYGGYVRYVLEPAQGRKRDH